MALLSDGIEQVSWQLSDGVVSLRPPRDQDEQILIAGRDAQWRRWLGPGVDHPRPTAVIVVDDEVVGWVDYDPEPHWLNPNEVNVGYNVFASYRRRGYATRAVTLLMGLLAKDTDHSRANLVIAADNSASLGVAHRLEARLRERISDNVGSERLRFVLDIDRD